MKAWWFVSVSIVVCVCLLAFVSCVPRGVPPAGADASSEVGTLVRTLEAVFEGKVTGNGATHAIVRVNRYLGKRASFYGVRPGSTPESFVGSISVTVGGRDVILPYHSTCDLTWVLYPSQVRLLNEGRTLEVVGGDGGVAFTVDYDLSDRKDVIRSIAVSDLEPNEVTSWVWGNVKDSP